MNVNPIEFYKHIMNFLNNAGVGAFLGAFLHIFLELLPMITQRREKNGNCITTLWLRQNT